MSYCGEGVTTWTSHWPRTDRCPVKLVGLQALCKCGSVVVSDAWYCVDLCTLFIVVVERSLGDARFWGRKHHPLSSCCLAQALSQVAHERSRWAHRREGFRHRPESFAAKRRVVHLATQETPEEEAPKRRTFNGPVRFTDTSAHLEEPQTGGSFTTLARSSRRVGKYLAKPSASDVLGRSFTEMYNSTSDKCRCKKRSESAYFFCCRSATTNHRRQGHSKQCYKALGYRVLCSSGVERKEVSRTSRGFPQDAHSIPLFSRAITASLSRHMVVCHPWYD